MTDSPQLGPFPLENRLGSGGMGVVYRGEHVDTGASVAIKIIHREVGAKARPGFHQEVQAHAGLRHPGIVHLFEYGEIDEAARHHYRRAAALARELHLVTNTALSHLNLAQVDLMERRFERAQEQIRRAKRLYESSSRKGDKTHLIAMEELTWATGTENWSRFDEIWKPYSDGWPEDSPLVKDHPWLLEMAGDYSAEAGARKRAERAWKLARELWARLDHSEAVARLDEKLSDRSE